MSWPAADFARRLAWLTWAWLGLLYLGLGLLLWAGDAALLAAIRVAPAVQNLAGLWRFLTDYGMYPFYLLFAAAVGWAWRRHDVALLRLGLGYWLAQFLGAFLAVRLLKMGLGRARPYAGDWPGLGVEWLGPNGVAAFHSFPSGHTADLFTSAVFTALLFRRPWAAALALGFALCMGFTRMALDQHYPSDVLGGMLIGGLAALGTARFWVGPYLSRQKSARIQAQNAAD